MSNAWWKRLEDKEDSASKGDRYGSRVGLGQGNKALVDCPRTQIHTDRGFLIKLLQVEQMQGFIGMWTVISLGDEVLLQ